MSTETINTKLVRILTENPKLPIKVVIDIATELGDTPDGWCVGELCDCEATEYVSYGPDEEYYFDYINDTLRGFVCEDIWDKRWDEVYKSLSENDSERCNKADLLTDSSFPADELERLAYQEIAAMDWKPCILLSVGPNVEE